MSRRPTIFCIVPLALVFTGGVGAACAVPIDRGAAAREVVPPSVPAEIASLYARHDAAFKLRDTAAFRKAVDALLARSFVEAEPGGRSTRRAAWLDARAAAAALGPKPWPGNTGGFTIFDKLDVTATTAIARVTVEGAVALVEVNERIATAATGRRGDERQRESTGAVFTTEARDRWRRTPQGWRWERREVLARFAMSSIAIEAPPADVP